MQRQRIWTKRCRDMTSAKFEEPLNLQLGEVLARHQAKLKSWNALAERIRRANHGESGVDRRKLQRLCTGDKSVSLTIFELEAIDRYLVGYNEGLAEHPVFIRNEDLLDSISQSSAINFFLAAKYNQELKTEVLSRWDVRCITCVIRPKLARIDVNVWDQFLAEDWDELVEQARGGAKIAVGSPFVATGSASERLMERMLDLPSGEDVPRPFYFTSGGASEAPQSDFIRTTSASGSDSRGIHVLGNTFISKRGSKEYGLLLAQRDAREQQVHVVLGGTTGPSTYALAEALQRGMANMRLPPAGDDIKPPILVAVFAANLVARALPKATSRWSIQRETRELQHVEVVLKPTLLHFDPHQEQWHERSTVNMSEDDIFLRA